tara:strand:- start:1023 stop:1496 length:474 start_codon:yes stop_codon:yes gene_type:complete
MKPGSLEYAEWLIDQLLYNSVQSIDARLGEGYHTKNPRLVCELTRLTYEEYKRQENFELEEAKAQEVSSYNFVKSLKSKKPQFKFSSFGIPVGAELQCTLSPHIKCTVADGSNGVRYNGEKTSMSAIINSLKGGSNRGPSFWTYRGKLLSDMVDQKC